MHDYQGTPLIVTYHPAYLLRSLPDKAKAWEDLLFAAAHHGGLQRQKTSGSPRKYVGWGEEGTNPDTTSET